MGNEHVLIAYLTGSSAFAGNFYTLNSPKKTTGNVDLSNNTSEIYQ